MSFDLWMTCSVCRQKFKMRVRDDQCNDRERPCSDCAPTVLEGFREGKHIEEIRADFEAHGYRPVPVRKKFVFVGRLVPGKLLELIPEKTS